MARSFARRTLPIAGAAFLVALLVQVFLAGLGVFDDPAAFLSHRGFGYVIGWFTLAILVLALLGRQRSSVIGLSILLLIGFALQSVFVILRADYPAVAALHPVNGFLLLLGTAALTRLALLARHEAAAIDQATTVTGAQGRVAAPADLG